VTPLPRIQFVKNYSKECYKGHDVCTSYNRSQNKSRVQTVKRESRREVSAEKEQSVRRS
jgi:hypothetical protein